MCLCKISFTDGESRPACVKSVLQLDSDGRCMHGISFIDSGGRHTTCVISALYNCREKVYIYIIHL